MAGDSDGKTKYPNNWAVLADKCYRGILEEVTAVLAKKRPTKRQLFLEQKVRKDNLESDCAIVETFFSREVMLWKDLYLRFTWAE